jgi:hypothetical protein
VDTAFADALAPDAWTVGQAFYFGDEAKSRAAELGINVIEFYGLGRGGVLGAVSADDVEAAFTFFPRSIIDYFWARAGGLDVTEVARVHLEAADAFARRAFASLDRDLLEGVANATEAVLAAVEPGRFVLVDGYRRLPRPDDVVALAYRGVVELRELRGGVHIEAVAAEGLSAPEAAYLDDEGLFRLHGYGDADIPEVTDELRARRRRAEEATSAEMARYLDGLSEAQREALARGLAAMRGALAA